MQLPPHGLTLERSFSISLVEKYAQTAKPQKRLVKALDFIQTIIMLLNQILKFSFFISFYS